MKIKMQTWLKDSFETYKNSVYKEYSEDQIKQLEMAFYAGSASVMIVLDKIIPILPDEVGERFLTCMKNEVDTFADGIIKGHIKNIVTDRDKESTN